MQLTRPFIRLPLTVDAERLRTEIEQFGPGDWRGHPQGHPGNSALPFVARRGQPGDDGVAGPMGATPHLARCPYVRQVLAALRAPIGRSRLMRLDSGAEATAHFDSNYYWSQRVRVHIPVVTTPGVRFLCGDAETHMAQGEVWIFDTWRLHNVLNPPGTERIHLVVDTVGSDAFWAMTRDAGMAPSRLAYVPGEDPPLTMETVNFPVVMSPYEFDLIWSGWKAEVAAASADASTLAAIDAEVHRVQLEWRATWAAHGEAPEGWPKYAVLVRALKGIADRHAGRARFPNGQDLARHLEISLVPAMHAPDLSRGGIAPGSIPDLGQARGAGASSAKGPPAVIAPALPATRPIARPLIILCAPRSGSTLLFERLAACSPDWYTVGNESHLQIEGIAALQPARRGFDSNVLNSVDATDRITAELRARFLASARDRDGAPPPAGAGPLRLLEKTPKNALRVNFLREVFPDALFLYLWREPEESLASLIEGWQSGLFATYPDLPQWPGPTWSYLLVPGWRELAGRPLPEIVATQWRSTQERLLADMAGIAPENIRALDFADFLADPERALRSICAFAGVRFDRPPPAELPHSIHTLTPPAPDKWRQHEVSLAPLLPALTPIAEQARAFVAARRLDEKVHEGATTDALQPNLPSEVTLPKPLRSDPPAVPADAARAAPSSLPDDEKLASMFTDNLPDVLRQLRISLLVTNYQGGNLIAVRADGATVNTHFVHFAKPMGLAVDHKRLVVGTESGIREFRNVPDVSQRIEPKGRHDAVYVFRNHHVTGNINIHEMAIGADNELWFVNTRFSCLCTLDLEESFRPRWRPSFITGYSPEDRCHLNGLAMVDGRPRWLTALGATDTSQGWRANTKNGGVIIDYATRDVIVPGLSMPHSPRWYRGRLWVLESGRGSLGTVDLASGKVETVARLPGFTRGLDFVGPLAFVGLSQLRETNPLTDIPITDENIDRMSGVWVVNIETGETIAILKFGGAVEEVFAVQALPGILFPEVLDDGEELLDSVWALPDEAFKDVRFVEPVASKQL